ncbi:TPA: tagatose-6-phosphate kinase, partial [Klebsiella pneumoniae]|nr:tagatose-6-phosphate kinase [Klebsiella pneumoniae]
MILTISLNPGLDITYSFTHFHLNNINRVSHNKILKVAGGKTLNVTRVIKQSGTNVLSTGIVGGLVGEEIIQLLNAHGVRNDFYRISGNSRNNITIATEGKS